MTGLCQCAGITKQAFYKAAKRDRHRRDHEDKVLALVREVRQRHPRMGTRKMMVVLAPRLAEEGIAMGRNKLFDLLRRKGLLVRRKRSGARTTDSRHHMKVYRNELREATITGPNQAFVSDLTYLRTQEGFAYAVFVTDVYSRKIVGWDVSASLEMSGCMRAVAMALEQVPPDRPLIHHSDRGSQYCSGDYTALLKARGVTISMTEENHCYENGKAERLNGIMKQEYGLGEVLLDPADARKTTAQGVWLYNNERPHTALGYAVPEAVHGGCQETAGATPGPICLPAQAGAPPQTPGFSALGQLARVSKKATAEKGSQP